MKQKIVKKYHLTKDRLLYDLYFAFFCAERHKRKMAYVQHYREHLHLFLSDLCERLWNRTYYPGPSSCFIISDPTLREVFAADFEDRIVHHLYYNYTHEMYERTFIEDSYSCIPGRGTGHGVERLYKHIRSESQSYTKECYILKLDIRGYFMHINRSKLLKQCKQTIRCMQTRRISKKELLTWEEKIDIPFILWLTEVIVMLDPIENCIRKGDQSKRELLPKSKSLFFSPKGCGLPIGNLTSQLFSNIYLNAFDHYMKRVLKCKHYGRYVDDAYVVSCSRAFLHKVIPLADKFLMKELGLELHKGKIKIARVMYGTDFLGVYFKPWRLYTSTKSLHRINLHLNQVCKMGKQRILCSINSYLGTMKHCASFNLRTQMMLNKRDLYRIGYFNEDMTVYKLFEVHPYCT